VSCCPSTSRSRHPELVSGSIGKLALSDGREAQPHRKIDPMRIFCIDEVDFLWPMPVLQLLLARNGRLHRAESFEMNQPIYRIFGSMTWRQVTPVLRKSLRQVGGYANVKRAVELAGKDIYARLPVLSHRRNITAKWTLKQVQGDGGGNS
jgi:hypothetical protein